tara:strand:+ start:947 stop:1270 length:324 start_codon:yes stop_codon:yes gene_type:complete
MLSKEVFKKVKNLLQRDPRLRESDAALMARVWWNDLIEKGKDPSEMSATDFFVLMADKKLSSYEGITRGRRKIMEECPELRGTTYAARKKKAGDVKNQIKDWNNHII